MGSPFGATSFPGSLSPFRSYISVLQVIHRLPVLLSMVCVSRKTMNTDGNFYRKRNRKINQRHFMITFHLISDQNSSRNISNYVNYKIPPSISWCVFRNWNSFQLNIWPTKHSFAGGFCPRHVRHVSIFRTSKWKLPFRKTIWIMFNLHLFLKSFTFI